MFTWIKWILAMAILVYQQINTMPDSDKNINARRKLQQRATDDLKRCGIWHCRLLTWRALHLPDQNGRFQ